MLVLTRRRGETVKLGDDISVTIIGIVKNQVRLGFKAPDEMPIHREEIYRRIKKEQMEKCRVSIEERNHDLPQEEEDNNLMDTAKTIIENGSSLEALVFDYGLHEVFDQLARAMRNFDLAANGCKTSEAACLNALSLIQRILVAQAMENISNDRP